ncbi:hypothetical protein CCP3SC15_530015 [Gammaproteobacteria bacterium]
MQLVKPHQASTARRSPISQIPTEPATKTQSGSLLGRLLSDAEVSILLGVTVHTLAVWRSTGRYNLPYVKAGHLVRYKESDLEEFIARRTVGAATQAAV